MCQVSRIMCQVSHVPFHVSHVMCHMSLFFFGQRGEAHWWRVCYQQGLPRPVLKYFLDSLFFLFFSNILKILDFCLFVWIVWILFHGLYLFLDYWRFFDYLNIFLIV